MNIRMAMLVAAAVQIALPVAAHDLTIDECMEAGEFIMHAAMSRDSGMSRAQFVARMQDDLVVIQAYPPELRWFVQDEADQTLLVGEVERVFDDPRTPGAHQKQFLRACFERLAQQWVRTGVVRADAQPVNKER
jgi:hypothetical protein